MSTFVLVLGLEPLLSQASGVIFKLSASGISALSLMLPSGSSSMTSLSLSLAAQVPCSQLPPPSFPSSPPWLLSWWFHEGSSALLFLLPPEAQLTVTGHGCADPVSAGTDAAVTVHLGLSSIGVHFILQGTLCWDQKIRDGSLGWRWNTESWLQSVHLRQDLPVPQRHYIWANATSSQRFWTRTSLWRWWAGAHLELWKGIFLASSGEGHQF